MNKVKFYSIFAFIIGIVLITVGASYAFLSVRTQGKKETSVKLSKITFHYDEKEMEGISLIDALPMSDELGKKQTNYFEFRITSEKPENMVIPYEITARKKDLNNLIDDENVKIYLTKVVNNEEQQLLFNTYNNVASLIKNNHEEQVLYISHFDNGSTSLDETFRLRLWVDENTNYSAIKDENKNLTYPMEGKEFSITINVYTDDTEGTVNGGGQVTPSPTAGLYTMDDELIEDWDQLVARGLVETDLSNGKAIVEATLADHNIETGKLVLADTVTSVADQAFKECTGLGAIVFDDNVTTLGEESFYGSGLQYVDTTGLTLDLEDKVFNECTSITYAKLGEYSLISGYEIFTNCTNLKNVEVGKANVRGSHFAHDIIDNFILRDGGMDYYDGSTIEIKNLYVYGGTLGSASSAKVENLYIGEDVNSTWTRLTSSPNLKTLEIYSATSVADYAYVGCQKLESVTIGPKVTSIGSTSFRSCAKLENLTLYNGLTSIGNSAFDYTSSLGNVVIPGSVKEIKDQAFYKSGLTSLVLSEGVERVGYNSFAECGNLTSVSFPSTLTFIDSYGFYKNPNLGDITIDSDDLVIYNYAFSSNNSVENVVIKGSNTQIYSNAFSSNANLKYVEIENTSRLSSFAFSNLSSLESVKIDSGVIADSVFSECPLLETVTLGNMSFIGGHAFNDIDSIKTISIQNCDSFDNSTFYGLNGLETVYIGQANSLPTGMFNECTSLSTITFGDNINITSIGENVFKNTALTSFTVPASVSTITKGAFAGCTNLTSVIFENTSNWYENNVLLDVTSSSTNATKLKDADLEYNWIRNGA